MKKWILPFILILAGGIAFLATRSNIPKTTSNTTSGRNQHKEAVKETDELEINSPNPPPVERDNGSPIGSMTLEERIESVLQKGTYTILDNGLVSYSADARIRFPTGTTISAGEGFMISDYELKTFGGDILIGSGPTPHFHKGLFTLTKKGFTLTTLEEDIDREVLESSSNQ